MTPFFIRDVRVTYLLYKELTRNRFTTETFYGVVLQKELTRNTFPTETFHAVVFREGEVEASELLLHSLLQRDPKVEPVEFHVIQRVEI